MSAVTVVGAILVGATFVALWVALGFLVAANRKGRATLLSDLAWKATVLVMVIVYLGWVAANSTVFIGDPGAFALAESVAHLLVAAFFLYLGVLLWRSSRQGVELVLVSPEFLVALRSRTRAMYGDGPSRFISYAVAKEAAASAIDRVIAGRLASRGTLWRRLPYLFRLMGYGKLSFVEGRAPGPLHVEVEGTFEASHGDGKGGCDLTRGYLAGLGEALEPGMSCEAEETRCVRLHGGEACAFTLRWFPPMDSAQVQVKLPSEAR